MTNCSAKVVGNTSKFQNSLVDVGLALERLRANLLRQRAVRKMEQVRQGQFLLNVWLFDHLQGFRKNILTSPATYF